MKQSSAEEYIKVLQLSPHPEGGFYRQIFGNNEHEQKTVSTIYYLLENDQFSAFHRLHNMIEIWYYHAGNQIDIYVIKPDGEFCIRHLGKDEEMQVVIEPGEWFAAQIHDKKGFSLVGCAVSPAFDFKNFELADKQSLLKQFPKHKEFINRLCK